MEYTSKAVYDYISDKTNDPIIEWQTCTVSGQPFPIYQSDVDFYDKISPTFEATQDIGDKLIAQYPDYYSRTETGKLKVQIPTPTLCPEERQRRRLAFRNERKLYKRRCDFTGKEIISIYSPDKLYKVYDQKAWWGDERYAMEYGKVYKMDELFTYVIRILIDAVPKMNLINIGTENSEYNNMIAYSKDCYLTLGNKSDHCYYCFAVVNSEYCCDCYFAIQSLHCYDSSYLKGCYGVFGSFYLQDCRQCYRCRICVDCIECIDCMNLVGKQYCIDNIEYSEHEYFIRKQTLLGSTYDVQFSGLVPSLYNHTTNASFGSFLHTSSGMRFCHDCDGDAHNDEIANSMYVSMSTNLHDVYDAYDSGRSYYSVELQCVEGYHMYYSNMCIEKEYLLYCDHCFSSFYLFGCAGLRNKEYCIFNKQYTKEEWHDLVPQVIAQMIQEGSRGEFFHPQLSPFGYNETVAQEYYPLTKDQALKLGYKRSDYEAPLPQVEKIIPGEKLPILGCADIQQKKPDLLRDILRYAIRCEVSKRPFKLIQQEIDFYVKHNLPLPTKHPDVRHAERMARRPGRTLYLRDCDQCGEEMLSVYKKDSASSSEGQIQKVYCEKCYKKEVFG